MLLHDHTRPYLGGCSSEPCIAHVLRVHTTAQLSSFSPMYVFCTICSDALFTDLLLYCMIATMIPKMITVAVL